MYLLKIPESFDPRINLAVEEYFVRHMDLNDDLLFIYRNNPAVIIGKNQNPFEEINLNFLAEEKIDVFRRISGGGAVYHDPGNINFSYFTKNTRENFNNYTNFLKPVIELLNKKNVPARINERNDIVVGELKISGNAQFTTRGKMFSHGTLLFNADLNKVSHTLDIKNKTILSKSTKSVRSQVTNIFNYLKDPVSINFFLKELVQFITGSFSFSGHIKPAAKEWAEIKKLAIQKYGSWDWNWGHTPRFIINITDPFSKQIIYLNVENCIINSKDLDTVDSFSKLLSSLNGIKYNIADVKQAIENFPEINSDNRKLILQQIFPTFKIS